MSLCDTHGPYATRADLAGCPVCEIARLRAENEAQQDALRNLLAVIHRDGGHYAARHGDAQAARDGERVVLAEREQVDSLALAHARLREWLVEIAETRGEFSLDHLTHAKNVIARTKVLAYDALAALAAPVPDGAKVLAIVNALLKEANGIGCPLCVVTVEADGKLEHEVECPVGLALALRDDPAWKGVTG